MQTVQRTSSLLTVALFLLAGCGTPGLSDKQPPLGVNIPQDCEQLAQKVPHYPVVPGKTDARVAYEGEFGRVDQANERLDSTRGCLKLQREKFGAAK